MYMVGPISVTLNGTIFDAPGLIIPLATIIFWLRKGCAAFIPEVVVKTTPTTIIAELKINTIFPSRITNASLVFYRGIFY
jgi:hypothetical protein